MRPSAIPQYPPSLGGAPTVGKPGGNPHYHLSISQTIPPTTSESPTLSAKEKFIGTTQLGRTDSPSVSFMPSGVPISPAPSAATSSVKQSSSKPNRIPLKTPLYGEPPGMIHAKPKSKMPVQNHVPSEAPSMFPTNKPTNGSNYTPTATLSLSLTTKPLSKSPTLHPSKETIQADPLTFQTSEQNSLNVGSATNATMSRSSGGTTSLIILAIATAFIALVILFVRIARRKKYFGTEDIHKYSQDQQHLTLQGSTAEIQGYVQRIDVSEINNRDVFDENESSKTPGSPMERSVSSRPWDRDVNQHFAQHFSPRSLVDQPSSSTVRNDYTFRHKIQHSRILFTNSSPFPPSLTLTEYVNS